MQIVRAPQLDQIRPRFVVISLCVHPLILLVTRKHEVVHELRAHEPLMVIRGRVDQVTKNLFAAPFVA
jgi:hypothetical protein